MTKVNRNYMKNIRNRNAISIAFLSHVDINLYLFRTRLMKEMRKRGCRVYAIVPRGEYTDLIQKEGVETIEYKISRKSLNPVNAIKTILTIADVMRRKNIVLLHSFTFKPNIYGAIAGALAGVPVIVNHITGLGYVYTERSLKAKLLRMISSSLYWIAFNFASMVVFQNRDDMKVLGCYVKPEKRMVIVSSGVDVSTYNPGVVSEHVMIELKKALGISSEQIVITLIARLNRHKGIYEFIDAAQELIKKNKNCLFLVIGWIDEGNPAALSKEYLKRVESKRIRFLGKRNDIIELLSITDIFVLPSYREGTPHTVLEAMAMGKPVVTTNVPGCRETIIHKESGLLIPAREYKPLVSALHELIMDKHERRQMGVASRKRAEEIFSDKIINGKIWAMYKNLLKQKGLTDLIGDFL